MYLFNIIIFAVLYPIVEGRKEVIALIPVMSNLRGDILGSSASRLNTLLHLGEAKPSFLTLVKLELKPTISIAMITSIIISIITYTYSYTLGGNLNMEEMVSISFLSSLIATLTLLPYIAFLASEIFRRGWDPGNLLPTLTTSVADMMTLPFLVIAFLTILLVPIRLAPILFLSIISLSISFYIVSYISGGFRVRRILRERFIILLLVMITHPLTGAFLAVFEEGLAERGLIHLTTTFIGINGALAAIAGVRLSSIIHIYGLEKIKERYAPIVVDVVTASIPGIILISLVGYVTHFLIPGVLPKLSYIDTFYIIMIATIIHITIGLLIALIASIGSFKLGLDPNNIVLPLITNIMDLTGIPVLYLVGVLLLKG